ncbi:MAG: 5'-nucleotidase C-terminal domain-containing protein [Bacilli bacterium]|nr:5'-nucleotidase C-terminal domain-containing protein [Bacilli bacterium]
MKKKIFLLSLLSLLVCSCGNHEHTFSSTYDYDNQYHWRKATCEHTDEKADYSKHNFGEWRTVIQPTEEENGKKMRTCKTCSYIESQIVTLPQKGTTIDRALTISEFAALSREKYGGSFETSQITEEPYFIKAEVSSAIYNSNNDVSLFFKSRTPGVNDTFTFENGKIDTYLIKDQYDAEGLENATVTILGYIETYYPEGVISFKMRRFSYEELNGHEYTPSIMKIENGIPTKDHVHKYADTWSTNETHHWHAATCSHSNLASDYGTHVFNEWSITKPATSTEEGEETRICSICGYTETKVINIVGHEHTYASEWSYDSNKHWHAATCGHDLKSNEGNHNLSEWTTEIPATVTQDGKEFRSCSICGYKEERKIDKLNPSATGTFTLYTFNDFHGAVNEYSSSRHIGLAKFGTYLKNVNDPNTLIIDSGDTYQGSIESNYNYGNMITDVLNYAHVDVHTLGNHDFDWGLDKIVSNKARKASDGWSMTNLSANIYDYDFETKEEGNVFQTQLGDKYYIRTLENGIKVGVVGVIGSDQITSICSPLVESICFKEHISVLKDLSDELRTEKGCNVVIASIHASASDSMGKGLSDISPISNKKYFDYVACAHSHQDENYTENGVRFTQASAYGEKMYKAVFTVADGEVTNCNVNYLNYSYITSGVSTVDPNITNIINSYAVAYSSVGEQVLTTSANGSFNQSNEMPNLLCKAMYVEANKQGYTVDVAVTNKARYNVSGSTIKYSSIYEAFPFDNVIYIAKIKGSKNIQQAFNLNGYNFIYHNASLTSVNENTWYTVAVIDYLLWHTNSSRYYDYFSHSSSYMQVLGTLKKSNGDNYLYRDICADYIRNYNGTLYASNYDSSNSEFSKPSVS